MTSQTPEEFYKKLGYTLIEIKSSVFREEESTFVFQTDNKNHTVDGSTILYDHAVAIHQQLQKARHDWLREEIGKLEGMKQPIDCTIEDLGYHDKNCSGCEYNLSIQTIIDRYQAELDQPINSIFKE